MAKTSKPAKTKSATKTKTAKARSTRDYVVSFRITTRQEKSLNYVFRRNPASGVKSSGQLIRKLLCDYLAGRLIYRNPADKLKDFDIVGD